MCRPFVHTCISCSAESAGCGDVFCASAVKVSSESGTVDEEELRVALRVSRANPAFSSQKPLLMRSLTRGSVYSLFQDSGSNSNIRYGFLQPESLNEQYTDA